MAINNIRAINCVVVALTMSLTQNVHTAPLGGKTTRDTSHLTHQWWYIPCQSDIETVPGGTNITKEQESETFQELARKTQDMSRISRDLMGRYIGEALHDPDYVEMFEHFHFNTFPLTRFTPDKVDKATSEIDDYLKQTYEELAAAAVYINQVVLENKDWNVGGASPFYVDLYHLMGQHADMLCTLNTHMKVTRGLVIDTVITEQTLDPKYHQVGTTETYKYLRDYFVVRDYRHYMQYLTDMFAMLENYVKQ